MHPWIEFSRLDIIAYSAAKITFQMKDGLSVFIVVMESKLQLYAVCPINATRSICPPLTHLVSHNYIIQF